MRYVKYMPFHSMKNASRNRREISVAYEQGYEVFVFSDDSSGKIFLPENISLINDGVVQLSYSMPRVKRIKLIIWNRIVVYFKTLFLNADVLSCHDLESLKIAYLATRLKIHRPKLIYDSHEFELGRNVNRSNKQLRRIKQWEKFLINRCAFCIVVNDTIAEELVTIYDLPKMPTVVRSTPSSWVIDRSECEDKRKEILFSFVDY